MKILPRNYLTLRKLSIAISRIGSAAYTTDDPLPRVAAQMQQQISNTVRLFIRPPPDLLIGEPFETSFDLGKEILAEMIARARNEFVASVVHVFLRELCLLDSCPPSRSGF